MFYLTEDGKYMIKTVSRKESKFLRRILPNYYNYVMWQHTTFILGPRDHEHTHKAAAVALLSCIPLSRLPIGCFRFFGLIRITTASHRTWPRGCPNHAVRGCPNHAVPDPNNPVRETR